MKIGFVLIGLAVVSGLGYTAWPSRLLLGVTVFCAVLGVLFLMQEGRRGRSRN
ncbi:hypothetical protein [Exiguobacterium sp. TNDT2]|uniref:hypothetical protein n=1 Tax=Exiguobacterium sp. TNDT2 TaxID=2233531 RepID=UPI0018E56191|nr:hypothetical protein [Exiguobacterium sp. TNDT2]